MPDLAGFNSAPDAVLRPLLTECLAVPRWVDAVLAGRPYADTVDVNLDLTDDEVRAAIAEHPRIGEAEPGSGESARWSGQEQSGVRPDDRLAAANRAYEDRFGHLYLVCAKGLNADQVLADLTARLANDPSAELRVVSRELNRIAALRLREVLA